MLYLGEAFGLRLFVGTVYNNENGHADLYNLVK